MPGDPEYIAAFQQIVMPVCYEFSPDLLFISAGFDAAMGDPLVSLLSASSLFLCIGCKA